MFNSELPFVPCLARCLRLALPLLLGTVPFAAAQAPIEVTLRDALTRAKVYGGAISSALLTTALAREDLKQAKAAALPTLNAFNQFIYTEGNGTPSGVFVANDGVHIYNEQAVVHQELFSLARRGEIRRAAAALATSQARIDVAARGLIATIVQNYYTVVSSGRKLRTVQTAVDEAQRFLDITQKQERGGEVAHSDVIKAQLQLQQRQRDLSDALLNADKAKVALAVLIFPDLNQPFTVIDDFENAPSLPLLTDASARATTTSPDVRAAQSAITEANLGVSVARYAYLPSFSFDFFYGINANQFAARTDHPTEAAGGHVIAEPNFLVPQRQNLGYSAQVTLNIPVWNWGSTQSKVRQASLKARQATLDLALAQRQLQGNLSLAYREAQGSQAQLESLRSSSVLSAESVRLTILRYQAGEATALEVVDAQTTAATARTGVDDGLLRYRLAIANLQTLTGTL
jgi:outer membrane protein TolC